MSSPFNPKAPAPKIKGNANLDRKTALLIAESENF